MIVEIVVGLLAVGALGYATYWYRKRVKWARIREEQMRRIKRLKKEIKGEK